MNWNFMLNFVKLKKRLFFMRHALSYRTNIREGNTERFDIFYPSASVWDPKSRLTNQIMSRLVKQPTKWHVRPVWSEFSLCAQWVTKDLSFLHVHSEDSDKTGRVPRLIWVFAGRTCHFVGFFSRHLVWTQWTELWRPNTLCAKDSLCQRFRF